MPARIPMTERQRATLLGLPDSEATVVAFHQLGRFRDRGLENQQTRAAALNLVTAAIILFNCRYLGRAVEEMRRLGTPIDPAMLARLSPLGWDRINLTGDYVWSEGIDLDADGLVPLLSKQRIMHRGLGV